MARRIHVFFEGTINFLKKGRIPICYSHVELYSKLKKSKIKKTNSPLSWENQFWGRETSIFRKGYFIYECTSWGLSFSSLVSIWVQGRLPRIILRILHVYWVYWIWDYFLNFRYSIFSCFSCQERTYASSCSISAFRCTSSGFYSFYDPDIHTPFTFYLKNILSVRSRYYLMTGIPYCHK